MPCVAHDRSTRVRGLAGRTSFQVAVVAFNTNAIATVTSIIALMSVVAFAIRFEGGRHIGVGENEPRGNVLEGRLEQRVAMLKVQRSNERHDALEQSDERLARDQRHGFLDAPRSLDEFEAIDRAIERSIEIEHIERVDESKREAR